jgi:two-component system, OmpR family, response regulator
MSIDLSIHILVVDDDPQIGDLLRDYLHKHGFRVSVAADGHAMKKIMKQYSIDLVVLDIMLPGADGISLCRDLRQTSDLPIIMLSAAGDESDRVVGLEVGADDYLAKPFSARELLARIKALIRRASGPIAENRQRSRLARLPLLSFGDWGLDQNKRVLIDSAGVSIALCAAEYDLLLAFLEHPGRTLTRDQLLDITRGRQANAFDRTIDVQVARLRKKLEVDPKSPEIIVTVRGGGYQFNAAVLEKQ